MFWIESRTHPTHYRPISLSPSDRGTTINNQNRNNTPDKIYYAPFWVTQMKEGISRKSVFVLGGYQDRVVFSWEPRMDAGPSLGVCHWFLRTGILVSERAQLLVEKNSLNKKVNKQK